MIRRSIHDQAQANLGQIKLNITQEGNRVQVGLVDPTESCLIGNLPYQVSYVIHVPAKTAVPDANPARRRISQLVGLLMGTSEFQRR